MARSNKRKRGGGHAATSSSSSSNNNKFHRVLRSSSLLTLKDEKESYLLMDKNDDDDDDCCYYRTSTIPTTITTAWTTPPPPSSTNRVSLSPDFKHMDDNDDDDDDDDYDYFYPLETVPDDVLAKCFFSGYVNSLDIVSRVSSVSPRTRRIARHAVKLLDLRKCMHLQPCNVENLVSRFTNLSYLDLSYCSQFAGSHLQKLVPLSRTLETLLLRGTAVTEANVVEYLECASRFLDSSATIPLRELDLSAVHKAASTRMGDSAVIRISLSCPHLERLHLAWCTQVTDQGVASLGRLQHLRELDLSLCTITQESCTSLRNMTWLQKLDLSATHVGDAGVRILMVGQANPAYLQDLLQQTNNNTTTTRNCNLTHLALRFNITLNATTLQLVANRAPNLQVLNISHCTNLDKDASKEVYRQLKNNGTSVIDEFGKPDHVAAAAARREPQDVAAAAETYS